jgi:hypothetical protein
MTSAALIPGSQQFDTGFTERGGTEIRAARATLPGTAGRPFATIKVST